MSAPVTGRRSLLGGVRWVRVEWPFLVLLAAGAVVRVLLAVAFRPGLVFSDAVAYLGFAERLTPSPMRPVGYSFVLRGIGEVSHTITAITATQHVVGLLCAVAVYALARRWSVRPVPAALATLPVLFDELQLLLEHSPLSDVVFMALVLLAVLLLARRPGPRLVSTLLAGLVLGAAILVRTVGEPMLLAAVAFCLLAVPSWRARARQVVAVLVGAALPIAAYAGWYHHVNGDWALSGGTGLALYQRSSSFVDCSTLRVPDFERTLCPTAPVSQRRDPTYYGYHDAHTVPALEPPAGISRSRALADFAHRAITQQPGGYLRVVLRDAAYGFWPERSDRFGYETAEKWNFTRYLDYPTTRYTAPAFAAWGGHGLSAHPPLSRFFGDYGSRVYLPGPGLAVLGLLGLAGLLVPRRGAGPGLRPVIFLCLALGLGLPLVPDLTVQFVWRYQLPALSLVPAAAALAWTRLRLPLTARAGPSSRWSRQPSGHSGEESVEQHEPQGEHHDVDAEERRRDQDDA